MKCKDLLGACIFLFVACNAPAPVERHGKVHVRKTGSRYTLYRNDAPFLVKGGSGYTHMEELHNAGGNTIRTWDTVRLSTILDEAHAHNLAVIVGLSLPPSLYLARFYKDTAKVKAAYRDFSRVIDRYKDHPALLMWCLGNELGFTGDPGYSNFYDTFNGLLKMIHAKDPDHPVTTTMANYNPLQILRLMTRAPDLDLISFNTFGKLSSLRRQLDRFSWLWNGPFLITEWGAYGPWESPVTSWGAPIENTSTKKAEHCRLLYEQHMPVDAPGFLGSMVFFWGQKQEVTPTWFSMFAENGEASESVATMQYIWTGHWPTHKTPAIKYMLVGNKGAYDNVILTANTMQTAELLMEDSTVAPLKLQWEILEEAWYEELKYKQPARLADTMFISTSNRKFEFRAPAKEGPYRIYVKTYDDKGNFSTANTPFYVAE